MLSEFPSLKKKKRCRKKQLTEGKIAGSDWEEREDRKML